MPIFDRGCEACGWSKEDCLEAVNARDFACPKCGEPTERLWLSKSPMMIPDTFNTPLVDNIMTKDTQVFHSRSEHRDAMRANGLRLTDTHVGMPGTDKSKWTTNWSSITPKALTDAVDMLTRPK